MNSYVKKENRLLWAFVSLILAVILLAAERQEFFSDMMVNRDLSLLAYVEEQDPEIGERLASLLFQGQASQEQAEKGKAVLKKYGYTSQSSHILKKRLFPFKDRKLFIAAGVLILLLSGFLMTAAVRLRSERIRRSQQERFRLQKQLMELSSYQEVNKRLKIFIENIAHQIKTPLAGCLTSLELLEDDLEEKEGPALPRVRECLGRMDDIRLLTERLLSIGRLEAGEVLFTYEEVELKSFLEELAEDYEDMKKSSLSFTPPGDKFLFYGSPAWLYEALSNLMKNCAEYDESPFPLRLSCEKETGWYRIRIRDHGPGFSEDDLPYIFDRFYRPRNEKKGHVGLGLNLARLIIEGHKGKIYAGNAEGGGAEFTVLLPLYETMK
ncbi:MAG: HAMP domain-containing histidine kinase [Lachnospiraceae bacterium]|nr:HAMP domain-containing histidine kinase [Lachnospiraceae bacterium]